MANVSANQLKKSPDVILNHLLSLHPRVIDLSLDRIRDLLKKLGNPQDRLPPTIHVAGTNGKGSVVATMRACLEAAGKKVHVYSSPHLVAFRERIRLAGSLISDEALSDLLWEVEAINKGEAITFFEITTAAAFLAFAREPADVLLLEVGLGGRLDATNVLASPRVTVITPVSIDHESYLGDNVSDIAREKAGIMRPGVPVITSAQSETVDGVLSECAECVGAHHLAYGQDWLGYSEHGRLVIQHAAGLYDLPLPSLVGHHQINNASTAIMALQTLNLDGVTEAHFAKGLQEVEWPGRLQFLSSGALVDDLPSGSEVWLDGGHNEGAAAVVASAMAEREEHKSMPLYLVFGMLDTKTPERFVMAFAGLASGIFTVTLEESDNAIPAEALQRLIEDKGSISAIVCDHISQAMARVADRARREGPVRVLITGSLYLVGDTLRANKGPMPT